MANHLIPIPFIKRAEGHYVNDPLDAGGETMIGITYRVWGSVFGPNAHARFMAMSDADWALIWKKLYWDACLGDQIKSQRIANVISDWVWGSGKYYPEQHFQHVLNTHFGLHLTEDGNFGGGTIAAINAAPEEELYKALIADHLNYIDNIVAISVNKYKSLHPNATEKELLASTQKRFLAGWDNRVNNLTKFNLTMSL